MIIISSAKSNMNIVNCSTSKSLPEFKDSYTSLMYIKYKMAIMNCLASDRHCYPEILIICTSDGYTGLLQHTLILIFYTFLELTS